MGFITPTAPPAPPDELLALPFFERIRLLTQAWVTDGFGTPRVLHVLYILKMLGLFFGLGVLIACATTDASFLQPQTWWDDVAVYQKLAVWLMLLEIIGLGGAWGPLCGHFRPMTGNIRFWVRPGTLRMAPWGDRVPGTAGDTRTVGDVLLYLVVLGSLLLPLCWPAGPGDLPGSEVLAGWTFVPVLVAMPLLGLRDKVIFLAARSEQYLPIMLWSAILAGNVVDLVIALKVVIVVVWIGAGVSKFGQHFVNVVPPMVSNAPLVGGARVRRAHYRNPPEDLRPSRLAWFMAHIGGTTVEILIPLVLLVTTNATVALLGALAMVAFHLFITATFPLAVPLEWNIFFAFAAISLWIGHDPAHYSLADFSSPALLVLVFVVGLFFPVLGNLRPDLVSFLPSMRQYAGNWASAVWAMRPGIEERLNELPGVENQIDQLQRMVPTPYTREEAEVLLHKALAWRAMHSQGRGLFSVLQRRLPDLGERTVREGEFVCNTVLGWNFGDGHLHDHRLVAAVQRRLQLAPGDLVVVWVESQPIGATTQAYQIIDAALGVIERGTWSVDDCVAEQPWLPRGPVPVHVTWRHDDQQGVTR